jgi:hypothetical protein
MEGVGGWLRVMACIWIGRVGLVSDVQTSFHISFRLSVYHQIRYRRMRLCYQVKYRHMRF